MPLLRIALLHHWFVTRGGGERVAECLAALLPTADLFSLVYVPEAMPESLRGRKITASILQSLPSAYHRQMMPLFPEAARSLDLRSYDLVVSSDSGPVKGARMRDGVPHLCYCHSPMRYLYEGYEEYRASMSGLTKLLFTSAVPRVRKADKQAAMRVTRFVANSSYIADRIRANYGREADVVHPPIDLMRAHTGTPGEAYLAAGRLVSYKRTEVLIGACNLLKRPLRIVGAGPEEERLRRIAGDSITFLGELSTDDLWNEYSRARALLFAADEDFGMVPLEAQSCGRPVIAYGFGGSLETVRGFPDDPRRTGIFFEEQTAESLAQAILAFEAQEQYFRPEIAQAHAAEFATAVFMAKMRAEILRMMPDAASSLASIDQALKAVA